MTGGPRRELSLTDATALIVGVIVGVGIFQVAPEVARGTPGAAAMLGLWAAGAAISWCGATVYAQLAAAHPEGAGGDYVYLTRAYGPAGGFLFAWLLTVVVRPGDIAVMAYAFATYASAAWRTVTGGEGPSPAVLAAGAVAALTAIHSAGVRLGTRTQNLLTALKVGGLLMVIVLAGSAIPPREPIPAPPPPLPTAVAMILVLFSYGGWSEIAFVVAEVREPRRVVPRALALGIGSVAALYLLANGAFLHACGGWAGLAGARAVAAEATDRAVPGAGGWVAVLIALSALGAVHALVFTGARVPAAAGTDHRLFRPLAHWSLRSGAPVRALVLQGALAIALVLAMGSFTETLLYTAAPVYAFQTATALALPVLRHRAPDRWNAVPRWGHPWTTLAFVAACVFLVWRAVLYRPLTALVALGLAALGWPVGRWFDRSSRIASVQSGEPIVGSG